ncbi:hypothetical protein HPB50_027514 [Hyalomma asiaticum]|uniref:Uncharacterized protein n=1 Tax=Hyalomma asiaticum TaxID=266040 RepID=A0ACB7T7C6_HYAAI|nr:hypothetical protein HPB50_027514 [Hyalomma asiaticum]
MASSQQGKAVRILSINDDYSWQLEEDDLGRILLQDSIKDKPVMVVSIAGAYRKGKSYLMNFFIRYMRSRGQKDWLGHPDAPLEGFDWKHGSRRLTCGIVLWNEVFLVTTSDGEEVAVLLMDTQGLFDFESTTEECANIFALSLLTSSVQIYNVFHNIQEDNLQHLEFFTQYGQLALKEAMKWPFQRLILLVRDSNSGTYGAEAGRALVKECLEPTQHSRPENQRLRESLRAHFPDIEGFLMPHPGSETLCETPRCVKTPALLRGKDQVASSPAFLHATRGTKNTPAGSCTANSPAKSFMKRITPASRLPKLPKDQIRIIVHPEGGLDVSKADIIHLAQALAVAATLTERQTCEDTVSAYIAASDATCKSVIRNIDPSLDDGTLKRMIVNARNSAALEVRRIKNTHVVVILFDGMRVPNRVMCGAALVLCFLYKRQVDVSYACGHVGHRADVCASSAEENKCHGCGAAESSISEGEHQCTPKCEACGGPHITGDRTCRKRRQNARKAQMAGTSATPTAPPDGSFMPARSSSRGRSRSRRRAGSRKPGNTSASRQQSRSRSRSRSQTVKRATRADTIKGSGGATSTGKKNTAAKKTRDQRQAGFHRKDPRMNDGNAFRDGDEANSVRETQGPSQKQTNGDDDTNAGRPEPRRSPPPARVLVTPSSGGRSPLPGGSPPSARTYVQALKSDELPEPKSLLQVSAERFISDPCDETFPTLQASAEASHLTAKDKAAKVYMAVMSNIPRGDLEKLKSKHMEALALAKEMFNSVPKIGGDQMSKAYLGAFTSELQERFSSLYAEEEAWLQKQLEIEKRRREEEAEQERKRRMEFEEKITETEIEVNERCKKENECREKELREDFDSKLAEAAAESKQMEAKLAEKQKEQEQMKEQNKNLKFYLGITCVVGVAAGGVGLAAGLAVNPVFAAGVAQVVRSISFGLKVAGMFV